MMPTISDEQLKEALAVVLLERRDRLREVVEEIIKDAGLLSAIVQGETGKTVSADEVHEILRSPGNP